jgi:carboxylesterase
MQAVTARDSFISAAAAQAGPGRTAVILLHGLCSTPNELRTVESTLRGLGYPVHPMSIEGYSFEPEARVQRATSFAEWIDTIERKVNLLRTTHERVLLIGISAGAALALGAAIRCGDRIDAMVLMSTTLSFDGWGVSRLRILLPLALYTPLGRWWKYRERAPYGVKNERVRAWIERDLRTRRISSAGSSVIGVEHLREHDRLLRHVRRRLDRVTCPQVLALHAREDEVASLSNLSVLASALHRSAFRAVVLGNSFHMITIDNDRQQVVREVVDFASTVAQAAPERIASL